MVLIAGDHALLDMSSFMGLQAKQVTVRTKARESQSGDSVPTPVPIDLLKNARGMNRVSGPRLLLWHLCFNVRHVSLLID